MPVPTPMTAQDAKRYLNALHSLDLRPEPSELRAAGVAQTTIERLYPVEFEDLAPGLIKLLGPGSLDHLKTIPHWAIPWNALGGRWGLLLTSAPMKARRIAVANWSRFDSSAVGWELLKHVTATMPLADNAGNAKKMLGQLWEARWWMVHPVDSEQAQIANEFLPDLLESNFPDFIQRVASLA